MFVGTSVAALSVSRTPVSPVQKDPQSSQPRATDPHTDSSVVEVGAARTAIAPVQPAADTQKNLDSKGSSKSGIEELSEEEKGQVRDLKQADAKVRAHEQAHSAAGGSYASGPSYTFTTGPDGKRYATAGEVQIDTAPVRDNPEATIRKMDTVIRAALSPSDPSSQDQAVARNAQQQRAKAQSELSKQRTAERSGNDDKGSGEGGESKSSAQPGTPKGSIAEAVAAYTRTANENKDELAGELFTAIQELSIVV